MTHSHNNFQPDCRQQQLCAWLDTLAHAHTAIQPLTGDASYRRYYRLPLQNRSLIVMDAPLNKEDPATFMQLSGELLQLGLNVPHIFAANLEHGFLLLTDFGDTLLFDILKEHNADTLYSLALNNLLTLQQCPQLPDTTLTHYTESHYRQELALFEHWYVESYCQYSLNSQQQHVLDHTIDLIINQALNQPQVITHKDYHSRNLFLLENNKIGMIDFQDLLIGPIAYDVMSLLYDHYIAWPYPRIQHWARQYQQQLLQQQLLPSDNFSEFMQWIDWLALQRVLKNLGNFIKLDKTKNKRVYLKAIPRIFGYIQAITNRYHELNDFSKLLVTLQPKDTQ